MKIKLKREMSLFAEINFYLCSVLIVIIIAEIFVYGYVASMQKLQINTIKQSVTSSIQTFLNDELELHARTAKKVSMMQEIRDFFTGEKKEIIAEEIADSVRAYTGKNLHIALFSNDGSFIYNTGNIDGEQYALKKCLGKYDNGDGTTTDYDFFTTQNKNSEAQYICYFTSVRVFDYDEFCEKVIGKLAVYSRLDKQKMLESVDANCIELSLKNNKLGHKIDIIKEKIARNENCFNLEFSIYEPQWTISGIFYNYDIGRLFSQFNSILMFEVGFIIILIIFLQILIKKNIAAPVSKISNYVESLAIIKKPEEPKINGNYEIRKMSQRIYEMFDMNRELTRKIFYQQQKMHDAEISVSNATIYALNNQVNPHFLYNIFEVIRSIAVCRDVPEISKIVTSLSKILRYNLSDRKTVKIGEEIEIAKKYVDIMRIRFCDEINLRVRMLDEEMEFEVIKILLQPIIENSFNHGYDQKSRPFIIDIGVKETSDDIEISVTDNGSGFETERLQQIKERLGNVKYEQTKNIGLSNLNSRIKMLYGINYGVDIQSVYGCYTKVKVTIPKKNLKDKYKREED